MSRLRPLLRFLLFLTLAAGPLQAQTVWLCEMMDVPRQETCCCGDVEPAREADADAGCDRAPCQTATRAELSGCCVQAAEISYEPDADIQIAKPSTDRSDVELPDPLLAAYELHPPPSAPIRPPVLHPISVVDPAGTTLYLLTERLRL